MFVETRLRHVLKTAEAGAQVVAPVPWFPWTHRGFGTYADYARTPREEMRHGIRVLHPRYMVLPKIGMASAPFWLAAGAAGTVARLMAEGRGFDLIDAHYFYPDGVAAALLAQDLGKPLVITARGSDINLIGRYRIPRLMMRAAGQAASAVIAVSTALKDALLAIGVPGDKIRVLRNGVDLDFFRPPEDRAGLRRRLGITGPCLLSVGNLVELKGHAIAIRALPRLPGARLLIVGQGPEEGRLRRLAARLGVGDRVELVGAMSQDRLRDYYGAADALLLASSREGWPNVVLEAMACGTPVAATPVGGVPEMVNAPEAGAVIRERSPEAVAAAITDLLGRNIDRDATRRHAERFGWEEVASAQMGVYRTVVNERKVHAHRPVHIA